MSEAAGGLDASLVAFAGLLRRAGLPVGPADTLTGQVALLHVDLGDRAQVRGALRAAMTHRREHGELFDQAFALFWRDPATAREDALRALLQGGGPSEPAAPGQRRVSEAFGAGAAPDRDGDPSPVALLAASARERLQSMDFEAMSAAQVRDAEAEVRRLAPLLDLRRTRRLRPDARGSRIDLAATLRHGLRRGGEIADLARARPAMRPPPLVALCDISGSMARYAQLLLHFLHAVAADRDRMHVFLFGTQLTNVTRPLRHRDPEMALRLASKLVPDWSGGTRIGDSLAEFNQLWSRRVLGGGAVVLLVTDGLERGDPAALAAAMEQLHRSCHRLIWLNPLLRWDGFQPKSGGIRAMLPHVDEFRPVHNLSSLRALVEVLSRPAPPRGGPEPWRTAS